MAKKMSHDVTRLLAGAMAVTMVAGQVVLPANVGVGGLFGKSAMTARADDEDEVQSVTFATTSDDHFENDLFVIDGYPDDSGLRIGPGKGVTIQGTAQAKDAGLNITKIELGIGYNSNYSMHIESNQGTVNVLNGGYNVEISDINSYWVDLNVDEDVDVYVNEITIYYTIEEFVYPDPEPEPDPEEIYSLDNLRVYDLTYTGDSQTPVIIDNNNGRVLYEGTDYEFVDLYVDGVPNYEWKFVNAGHYMINIAGLGDYENTVGVISFYINKADITEDMLGIRPEPKNDLKYNGKEQELVTEGLCEYGTYEYCVDGGKWSENVPVGTIGNYTVIARLVGDANHNDYEFEFVHAVSIKASDLSAAIPEGAVVVDGNNKIVEPVDGIYTFIGESTYSIYSNDKLYPSNDDSFDDVRQITGKKDFVVGGQSYTYKCEVDVNKAVEADAFCEFAHVHSAKVASPSDRSDQLFVNCTTEKGAEEVLLAEISAENDVWFGSDPYAFEVYVNGNAYGVNAECIDCYFSTRDALNGNAVDPADMFVGGEYRINANIRVYYEDGTSSEMIIRKDINFTSRPMWECDFFYGDELLDWGDDGALVIPAHLSGMTYNGEEQTLGDITIRNRATGEELVLDTDYFIDFEDGTTSGKNADWYGFTVWGMDNYCDGMRIAWEIGKASADISVEAKPGIVFDSEILDASDFVFTADESVDIIKDGELICDDETWAGADVFCVGYDEEGGYEYKYNIGGAGEYNANIRLWSRNYEDIVLYDVPVTIAQRDVTITPHVDGGNVITYGNWAPGIWTDAIEEAQLDEEGNIINSTGFIPWEEHGDICYYIDGYTDWDSPMPAGTYSIGIEEWSFDNYNYNLIMDENAGKLVVEPKNLADEEVFLTYEWNDPWLRAEDNVPVFGYNADMQTVKLCYDLPEIYSTDLINGEDFTIISGSLRKASIGTYNVTVKGKGNYTGTATFTWKIVASDAPMDANAIRFDGFDDAWDYNEELDREIRRFHKEYDGKDFNAGIEKDWVDRNLVDSITSIKAKYYDVYNNVMIEGTPKSVGSYVAIVTVESDSYNDFIGEIKIDIDKRWTGFYRDYRVLVGEEAPALSAEDVAYFDNIVEGDEQRFIDAINDGKMRLEWHYDEWDNLVADLIIDEDCELLNDYDMGGSANISWESKSLKTGDFEIKVNGIDSITLIDNSVKDAEGNGMVVDPDFYNFSFSPTEIPGTYEIEVSGDYDHYRGVKTEQVNIYTLTEKKPTTLLSGGKTRVVASFNATAGDDFELVEYGLLYSNNGTITDASALTLDAVDSKNVKQAKNIYGGNLLDNGSGVVAVGYVTLKNSEGGTFTIYTDDLGGNYDELAFAEAITLTETAPSALYNGKNRVVARFSATTAGGYEITEYGLLYSNNGSVTDASALTLDAVDGKNVKQGKNMYGGNLLDNGSGVVAVGYVTVTNTADQSTKTIYTGNIGGSYDELAFADAITLTEKEPSALNNGKNRVVANFSAKVADGFEITEYGLLYSNNGTIDNAADLTLDAVDGKNVKQGKNIYGGNLLDNGTGVVAVGYVKVKNTADNTVKTFYTGNIGGNYDDMMGV